MIRKKLPAFCTALALSMTLASCGAANREGATTDRALTQRRSEAPNDVSPTIEPVQTDTLSTEKHGYGQGVQLDDKNRPTGALDFNSQYGKYNAEAIREDKKKMLLTFDQGYENGYTEKILDTLKAKKVKAVFFVLADYAEKNPELVKRMIDEGHIVGNHSVSHYSMPDLSAEQCREEIVGLHDYIKEEFGYEMTLFRPPMGEFSEQSLAVTKECGYKTMLWSYAYADWDTAAQPDPEQSKQKLISAAHEGAVYLLHSVSSTNAEILGDFIDGARANGFEFE
ncbi:MAG: polysaccharide deacetylase family protein [Oscillospiraceae bacterium]